MVKSPEQKNIRKAGSISSTGFCATGTWAVKGVLGIGVTSALHRHPWILAPIHCEPWMMINQRLASERAAKAVSYLQSLFLCHDFHALSYREERRYKLILPLTFLPQTCRSHCPPFQCNCDNTIHDTRFVLTKCTMTCLTHGNITVQEEGLKRSRAGFSRKDLASNLGRDVGARLCLFLTHQQKQGRKGVFFKVH